VSERGREEMYIVLKDGVHIDGVQVRGGEDSSGNKPTAGTVAFKQFQLQEVD
jgi:hypothetical protein